MNIKVAAHWKRTSDDARSGLGNNTDDMRILLITEPPSFNRHSPIHCFKSKKQKGRHSHTSYDMNLSGWNPLEPLPLQSH